MTTNRPSRLARWLLFGVLLPFSLVLLPRPASALSLNPSDYYDVDFDLAFSQTVVEPGEEFSITAEATVSCIKDMPIGMDEASVIFAVTARHTASGKELTLLDRYDFTVSDVPDWAGDEYATEETVHLSLPSDAKEGPYSVAAEIEKVSLDGWNVTSMIPASYRRIQVGTISCVIPEVTPPPPTPQQGTLAISILGHEFRPTVDTDGFLLEGFSHSLIEDELSIYIEEGTRCRGDEGNPLAYISATRDSSPEDYEGGVVLSAFVLGPGGAEFSPALRLGIAYDSAELPQGCGEDDLVVGYYDSSGACWQEVPSVIDTAHFEAAFETVHFSTFGLLAPTTEPIVTTHSAVTALELSPREVAPYDRVNVSVTVKNRGDGDEVYPLDVWVDGNIEHSLDVALAPGASQTLRFTVVRSQQGEYEVSAGALNRSFSVLESLTQIQPVPTSTTASETNGDSDDGLHPVYIVLLSLAGVAFLTVVVLVLLGVL
ncbi:MAG: hypothetical protein JW846_05345 [Dehalococcoidia bacterium]|nr:hypothetical protein [Dehalococcoidia bacterium]